MTASTMSSSLDITRLSLKHNQDIFTIFCCNDSFQLALDLNTIKTLLRVCKRAQSLLSFKVPHFHRWCQSAGLCHPDGQLRIGLTPSDQIALSLHCEDQATADRSWLEDRAEQGNAAASYFLARILQVDLDKQQSADESDRVTTHNQIVRHLKNAAEVDHSMAQLELAECYRNGHGVDQDHTKATELYRSLADRGISQGQIALGGCYEGGEGVDQDYNIAIEWYSKAEDQGSEDGRLHITFLRAWFSFIGHGTEQSDADALARWQEVATQSTDPVIKPIATHMVGWMHYLGRGTERDEQRGIKIIRDNQSDEFKLGESECLASVWNNIKSDSRTACKFFNLCQLGSDRNWLCRHLMAVCVFFGFGTTEDRTKAAGIFEPLADDGHSDSQFWIGSCYRCGGGVSRDWKKAFEGYSKSADQGNSYGQWIVGCCCYNGHGVTRDYAKALEWFRKSSEQGNRYGQWWLGNCYQLGRGVPEDIDTAISWFRRSADQGHESAFKELERRP
ncbi:uncharacterized protein BJ171DRAFT_144464 [Polychytrium aggregatum]|uniref:uncharacterized protein n=1 Tax=Polychytrium aggregatum TaxID=110093 RepID=UPI0022FE4004|nr:uncharacterized protein BJ171DRAFT_144464 [Polychytrium aggregatum]KAI9203473.1 hypothetical protein BJ171DRAFT_144464 [Polychytrium aggregatum]